MPAKAGQKMVGAYVDEALAERFAAWARQTDGGASAALRRMITEAVDGIPPASPAGVGTGLQIGVRLKLPERVALAEAARKRGTSPANWLRSLALVHLTRKPAWNDSQLDVLRQVAYEVLAIGRNLNQIARALNVAVQSGVFPPHQHVVAQEAADFVRSQMHRIVAMITGDYDYWGLPQDERPKPTPGARKLRDARAKEAERQRKNRPRRRPPRFRDGDD